MGHDHQGLCIVLDSDPVATRSDLHSYLLFILPFIIRFGHHWSQEGKLWSLMDSLHGNGALLVPLYLARGQKTCQDFLALSP